jgi:hypothetical protein
MIREYDLYFVIAPCNIEHRIPSDVNERFTLILGANCIPNNKVAFMKYVFSMKGTKAGGKRK